MFDASRPSEPIDLSHWSNVEPLFADLARRPLDVGTVEAWLDDWSALSDRVNEAAEWLSLRHSQNTEDPDRKAAYLAYVREIAPRVRQAEEALRVRLLGTGWSTPAMEVALKRFRVQHELYRDANQPLLSEEEALSASYSELVGGLTVALGGQELTLAALAARQQDPDRAVREEAWQARRRRMLDVRRQLDDLFDRLLAVRGEIAANAGYGSYRDYRWQQLHRFDYTPDDGRRFRRSILEVVVPALQRQTRRRAAMLSLDPLRPWDLQVDPRASAPLRPFSDARQLADAAARMLDGVHPDVGRMLRTMDAEGLLDLDNRKGKAPGGFCTTLPQRGRAFIFMNAVGTDDNVRTLIHEAGHALHVLERGRLRWVWQRRSPMEFSEVASMTMELLAYPNLDRRYGGPYDRIDAIRSQIGHLEGIIEFLPYMAVVDGFQEWVYSHPGHDQADRDQAWRVLHEQYCVSADWTGLEDSRASLWQHKQHIFVAPLYYVEYGLAQLGALQVWQASLADRPRALAAYRRALALGGTRCLPALYEEAGARLAFDPGPMREAIGLVERALDELYADLETARGASSLS